MIRSTRMKYLTNLYVQQLFGMPLFFHILVEYQWPPYLIFCCWHEAKILEGRKTQITLRLGPSNLTFSDTSGPSCPCLSSACSEGGSSPDAPSGRCRSRPAPPAWCPGWQTAPPPGQRWCPCPSYLCRAPWFKQHLFFALYFDTIIPETRFHLFCHYVDSERFTSTVFISKGSACVGGSP